jgi:hypothetical protein
MKTIDAINNYCMDDLKAVQVHDQLITILAKFEGKKITKRLETEVRKTFPNAHISRLASMTYLELDYRSENYSKYLLAYDDAPYTEENFRKHNAWSGSAALERITKNNQWASEQASKVEEKLLQVKRLLEELKDDELDFNSYDCPAYYAILREHDLEDLNKLL